MDDRRAGRSTRKLAERRRKGSFQIYLIVSISIALLILLLFLMTPSAINVIIVFIGILLIFVTGEREFAQLEEVTPLPAKAGSFPGYAQCHQLRGVDYRFDCVHQRLRRAWTCHQECVDHQQEIPAESPAQAYNQSAESHLMAEPRAHPAGTVCSQRACVQQDGSLAQGS